MFIGDKGIILNNGGTGSPPQIFPISLRELVHSPPPSLPRFQRHHREWIDTIKGGLQQCNFDYAARLTEIVLLGVISCGLEGKKFIGMLQI
jgi:hypothetical protein